MPLIQKPKQSDLPLDKSAGAPRLVKRLHLTGRLIMIYGFLWLVVFGYQYAIVDEKPYAQMGLVTFAVILILCGGWLSGIYSRWYAAQTEGELFAALRVTYAGALPTGLVAFVMQCVLVSCMVTQDSYAVIKVNATEPVKQELKWLLGGRYPEEQEALIEPMTLEWELKTLTALNLAQEVFLEAYSQSSPSERSSYFESKQLNYRSFQMTWREQGEQKTELLELDWPNAELYSYQETNAIKSFPICDLRVPILNVDSGQSIKHEVLFEGKAPDRFMIDRKPFAYDEPIKPLPPIVRVSDGKLVIRTNFIGSRWTAFCKINFPIEDRSYVPEPITWRSLNDLNRADYTIHFHLFPQLRANIHDMRITRYNRPSSYREFVTQLNQIVAFRILDRSINESGHGAPSY